MMTETSDTADTEFPVSMPAGFVAHGNGGIDWASMPAWDFIPQPDMTLQEFIGLLGALKIYIQGQEMYDRVSEEARRHLVFRKPKPEAE
jgi:hypothetical protein